MGDTRRTENIASEDKTERINERGRPLVRDRTARDFENQNRIRCADKHHDARPHEHYTGTDDIPRSGQVVEAALDSFIKIASSRDPVFSSLFTTMQSTEVHDEVTRNLANPELFQTEVVEPMSPFDENPEVSSPNSQASIFSRKKQGLSELSELQDKGVRVRSMTLEDDVDTIEREVSEKKNAISAAETAQMKLSVKTQRRMLLAAVSFIEYAHTKYNPLDVHLTGWGENVLANIDDYDSVFERLYYKYKNQMEMPPELELLIAVLTSAFMFHISNSFVKNISTTIEQSRAFEPRRSDSIPNSPMSTTSRSSRVVASPLASRITSDIESDSDI